MSSPTKTITFIPSGRGKARCAPDPNYPHGMAFPAPPGTMVSCKVELPFPAPECGFYEVRCLTCNMSVLISVAGRVDDARSLQLPCKLDAMKGTA
jgi:hypothetical protein